jgi:hypothetical protein
MTFSTPRSFDDATSKSTGRLLAASPHETETTPTGKSARQIPIGDHDAQTWASQDGEVWIRTLEPASRTWSWSAESRPIRENETEGGGILEVDVGTQWSRKRMRLSRAICSAWVECPDHIATPHCVYLATRGPMVASNLGWCEAGAASVSESKRRLPDDPLNSTSARMEGSDGGGVVQSEMNDALPLQYTWFASNGDPVDFVKDGFVDDDGCSGILLLTKSGTLIHSKTGFRSSHGGRMCPDGRSRIAVPGRGLLCTRDAIAETWHKGVGTHVTPIPNVTNGMSAVRNALKTCATVDEVCGVLGVSRSAFWQRLLRVAQQDAFEEAEFVDQYLLPAVYREELQDTASDIFARLAVRYKDISKVDLFGIIFCAKAMHRRRQLRSSVVHA